MNKQVDDESIKNVLLMLSTSIIGILFATNASANEMLLACNTETTTATFKSNGDLARTYTSNGTRTLIVEGEKVRADGNLRFTHCAKDEFVLKCSGGVYATGESEPTHYLTLNRVSGELTMKIYTNDGAGTLVRYANEVGYCRRASNKIF